MSTADLPAALRRSLRRTFGLKALREGQQAVIERVLAGQDTLAIMPTGAGKSLCYQLPALHLQGRTVVVSPLIALMHDQASKLEEAGVEAEQLNSARPLAEQRDSLQRIAEAQSDIVFTTPERLADEGFLDTLREAGVALLVVDEAHCISQWGHDFRPAFLGIGAALRALGEPPVLALTATAPENVVADIRQQLGRDDLQVIDTGIYRPNLRLQVALCTSEAHKLETLQAALAKAQGAGIVYVATVKACDELYGKLGAAGESVTRYHGRLRAAERQANQERFMGGGARVMVATNAFGMGIDKADLRFVIHWQMPGSLQAYYQEAGRAGRDGDAADCALLYFRRDKAVQQFFLARSYPDAAELRGVVDALSTVPQPLASLAQRLPGFTRHRLTLALTLLRDAGIARVNRARAWSLLPAPAGGHPPLETLVADYGARAEHEQEALERMVFYAQTGLCRWHVLAEYFDQEAPFEGERCGHCDNCLRRASVEERPAAQAQEMAAAPDAPATSGLHLGDAVRVPRYGEGRVTALSADEVAIQFPDGRTRSFVAGYVQRETAA